MIYQRPLPKAIRMNKERYFIPFQKCSCLMLYNFNKNCQYCLRRLLYIILEKFEKSDVMTHYPISLVDEALSEKGYENDQIIIWHIYYRCIAQVVIYFALSISQVKVLFLTYFLTNICTSGNQLISYGFFVLISNIISKFYTNILFIEFKYFLVPRVYVSQLMVIDDK